MFNISLFKLGVYTICINFLLFMEGLIEDICKSRGIPKEQIENYVNTTNFDKKQYICAYWLRGTCVFPKGIFF